MRYSYKVHDSDYSVSLTFDARKWNDIHVRKLPPPLTNVKLKIRRRRALFSKTIELGNVSVPSAPWFKHQLMVLLEGSLIVGVDDGLLIVDSAAATIQKQFKTGNTVVMQVVPDYDRKRVYVVNEAYNFVSESGSNFAAYRHDGLLEWRAPIAEESYSEAEGYSQIMEIEDGVIEVATWSGRCHLNAENGKIMDCWFTKGM